MSETVKLIIEIPKETYLKLRDGFIVGNAITSAEAIQNGIYLDSNDSDYAEAQAYFAGESYGWEEGRKALIEDIKAEIEKHKEPVRIPYEKDYFSVLWAFDKAIEILDSISKAESEDEE